MVKTLAGVFGGDRAGVLCKLPDFHTIATVIATTKTIVVPFQITDAVVSVYDLASFADPAFNVNFGLTLDFNS
jgi:hypothetical protein